MSASDSVTRMSISGRYEVESAAYFCDVADPFPTQYIAATARVGVYRHPGRAGYSCLGVLRVAYRHAVRMLLGCFTRNTLADYEQVLWHLAMSSILVLPHIQGSYLS